MTITFYSELLGIGYADGDYYLLRDGNTEKLIREVHAGRLCYRIAGTSKRIGRRILKKEMKPVNKQLEDIVCPF